MLNLRRLFRSYNRRLRSYAELLPWFRQVAPGLVLNLDGTLLALFEYDGLQLEGASPAEIDAAIAVVEIALRGFDEHNCVWTFLDKRRHRYSERRRLANPVADWVDDTWCRTLDLGNPRAVATRIAASYRFASGTGSFFDDIGARVVEHRERFGVALAKVVRERLSRPAELQRMQGRVTLAVKAFEQQLAAFESTLAGSLPIRRVRGSALCAELSNRANPASPRTEVSLPPDDLYFLNTLLATDTPRREAGGVVRFEAAAGDRLCAMLSVKGYPGVADNEVMRRLLAVEADFTLVQMFRFLEPERAKKHIQDQESHYRSNVKGPVTQVIEKLSGIESGRVNLGMQALAQDAQEALVEATRDAVTFGYHSMALQVLATDRTSLEQSLQKLHGVMANAGFGLVKENVNFFGAFALTLPGASESVLRTSLVSGMNLADLTAVAAVDAGDRTNAHLTEQRGVDSPALVLLPGTSDVPERFSLHVGDVGHFFIVGPAGAGKTTFVNFLMINWQRYAPCQLVVLDKGLSNWITLQALGGRYVQLAPGAAQVRLNPARWIGDAAGMHHFHHWLEIALRAFDTAALLPDEIGKLDYAVRMCAEQPGAHTLSKLWHILGGTSRTLAARLQPWTRQSERYGEYFDNEDDGFALSDITGIEVGDLLSDAHLAPALLAHVFQAVARKVDDPRRPTLIYLEEAWYLLRNEQFRGYFEDWIKTMRKHGACVGISTQSLADLRDCPIGPTLNDNIKTRILLPNMQAFDSREIYRDMLGLRDEEIEVLRCARQKRDYYVVQDARRRLVSPELPPPILALTRSDARAKELFGRHQARGAEGWLARYIEEICNATT